MVAFGGTTTMRRGRFDESPNPALIDPTLLQA